MNIQNDVVTLWDNGEDKLCLFSLPNEAQYVYTEGLPCVTIGISYENPKFKGCDTFTFFDRFYVELLDTIHETYCRLNGEFRLYDMSAETDGYMDFKMSNGKLFIQGQLGASSSAYSLKFSFEADQTLLDSFLRNLNR